VASFPLAMGGCCPAVRSSRRRVARDGVDGVTDQNASLVVNGTDAAILTGLLSGP